MEVLRPALAAIIEQVRPPIRRAVDLRKVLGLSQTVCWGIFTAVRAPSLSAMTSLLPGRRGMELFFEAAAVSGVPQEVVQRGRAAFEQFEQTVSKHAGSRAAFEAMVSGLRSGEGPSPPEASGNLLKHKRAMFRASSVLLGRQMRVSCQTFILHPAAGAGPGGPLDSVYVGGTVGLHRIRHDVPLQLRTRFRYQPDAGTPGADAAPQPLEPGTDSIGLLREFCSQPIPEFRPVEKIGSAQVYELVTRSIGVSGEVTVFESYIMRATASPGAEHGLARYVQIPCETYVGDILLHRSALRGAGGRPADPEVRIYAPPAPADTEFRDSDVLPMTERGEYLGEGLYAARTGVIPRYEELLAHVMRRTGWNPDEFHVFRCRVDYPLYSSRIRMTVR